MPQGFMKLAKMQKATAMPPADAGTATNAVRVDKGD